MFNLNHTSSTSDVSVSAALISGMPGPVSSINTSILEPVPAIVLRSTVSSSSSPNSISNRKTAYIGGIRHTLVLHALSQAEQPLDVPELCVQIKLMNMIIISERTVSKIVTKLVMDRMICQIWDGHCIRYALPTVSSNANPSSLFLATPSIFATSIGSSTSLSSSSSTASMSAAVLSSSVTSASNQTLPAISPSMIASLTTAELSSSEPAVPLNNNACQNARNQTYDKRIVRELVIYVLSQARESLKISALSKQIKLRNRVTIPVDTLQEVLHRLVTENVIDSIGYGSNTRYEL